MKGSISCVSIEKAEHGGYVLYVTTDMLKQMHFAGSLEECLRHISILLKPSDLPKFSIVE